MQEHNEIDLRNLVGRALTPEQWELAKKYIRHRAQAERSEAIRELLVVLWRGLLWSWQASRNHFWPFTRHPRRAASMVHEKF